MRTHVYDGGEVSITMQGQDPLPAPVPRTTGRARLARYIPSAWQALGCVAALLCAVLLAPVAPGEGTYLAAATQARAALRYDRALAFYAQAERAMPRDSLPYCLAGQVLMLQQEWTAAQAAYRACIARDRGSATAWLGLGDAIQGQGDHQAALVAWQRAAALGSTDALRRQGLLDEMLGRFGEARRAWASLPAGDPEALAHLGLLDLGAGDFAAAARAFAAESASADASHPPGQAAQWRDWLNQHGFLALAQSDPTPNAEALALAGYRFLAAGMPRLALELLGSAVARAPRDGEARAYLGWAEWLTGATDQAYTDIAAGLRLAPRNSFCWFAAGEVAATGGSTAAARTDFERGLLLDSRNPALWAEYGRVSLLLDDYVTGELALETAASLGNDPSYTAAYLNFYLSTHLGLDDGRARAAANSALQRWSDHADIVLLCGEISDLLGDPSTAYYAFLRARQLDPTMPAAWVWLGRYASGEGLYVEAALDLRTALALQPNGPLAGQARDLLAPLAGVRV